MTQAFIVIEWGKEAFTVYGGDLAQCAQKYPDANIVCLATMELRVKRWEYGRKLERRATE